MSFFYFCSQIIATAFMNRPSKPSKLTLVCAMHYAKLVLRSLVLVTLLVLYILYRNKIFLRV